jgi:predicted dehydrogenase
LFVVGYHVLVEKPMEVTVEDCEAILAAQKKSGAKLMIAYRLHHEPGTLDVIDRVRKGDFGDPRIFSSIFTQDLKPENHRAKQGNYFC